MMRMLATVVSVDENRHPTILLDGCAEGGEVAALRASGYNPQPGDRCMVAKVGMRFIAEYAVDGALSAGLSAYEIAVEHGFEGTEAQWLQSLVGTQGAPGQAGASAYQIAVANGFTGTEQEWLASLKGEDGAGIDTSAGRFAPIVCDFLSANTYGNAPLVGIAISGGICSIGNPEADHPGVVQLKAGSSANAGYAFMTDAQSILVAGGEYFEAVFKPQQIPGVYIRFGFHDFDSHITGTDGVWIEVSPASDTQLIVRGRTRSGGAFSYTDAFNISSLTWYRARLEVNSDASDVTFYLYAMDGTVLWSDALNTNLPTGPDHIVGAGIIATCASGGAVNVHLDLVRFGIDRVLTR